MRPMRRIARWAVLWIGLLVACGDDDGSISTSDTGAFADAFAADAAAPDLDAGPLDAAAPSPTDAADDPLEADTPDLDAALDSGRDDAGTVDAARPDAGPDAVGVVTGECGELDDTELLSDSSFHFRNAIDLGTMFGPSQEMRLSDGAREILAEGTAGGSSGLSEAFAFEVLHRCEGAALVKTETEIVYDPAGSDKTDILVEIDGHRIGVSVTRAVGFPFDAPYLVDRAQMLLERKLMSILESTMNVVAADAWIKQILHVIAYAPMHADSIVAAWALIDPSLRADTILYVTVTDGDDAPIY